MVYVITVSSKINPEQHFKVELEYRTEVGNRIFWKEQRYLVKEIIIVDPEENIIELKCLNITKSNKKPIIRATLS